MDNELNKWITRRVKQKVITDQDLVTVAIRIGCDVERAEKTPDATFYGFGSQTTITLPTMKFIFFGDEFKLSDRACKMLYGMVIKRILERRRGP
jgi:hypothetical protein